MRLTFATMPTSGSASHSGSGTEQVCTRAVLFPLALTRQGARTLSLAHPPTHARTLYCALTAHTHTCALGGTVTHSQATAGCRIHCGCAQLRAQLSASAAIVSALLVCCYARRCLESCTSRDLGSANVCCCVQVYTMIYKHGDDLRQDQLVLQIIFLMDRSHRPPPLRCALCRAFAHARAHCGSPFVCCGGSSALCAIRYCLGSIDTSI